MTQYAPQTGEEADLQLGVRLPIHDASPAPGLGGLAVQTALAAAVDDVDLAVLARGVLGRRRRAALLEALGVAGDLVPGALVALEVHRGHGLQRRKPEDLGGGGAAAGEREAQEEGEGRARGEGHGVLRAAYLIVSMKSPVKRSNHMV